MVAVLPDYGYGFVQMVISDISYRTAEKQSIWKSDCNLRELSPQVATTRHPIVQDALTSIKKHAHTNRVQVEMELSSGELQQEICVYGAGFPTGRQSRKRGCFCLLGSLLVVWVPMVQRPVAPHDKDC